LSGGWLTAVALLVGGGLLFVPALLVEGQVRLALTTLPLIVWLASVNTALAYTLWPVDPRAAGSLGLRVERDEAAHPAANWHDQVAHPGKCAPLDASSGSDASVTFR
jgi:hypothetical protein